MQRHLLIFISLLCLPTLVQAQPVCPPTHNAQLMEQCLNTKLGQVVVALKQNLDLIEQRFRHNPVLIAALTNSQQQWDSFRKQECGNVYLLWRDKPNEQLMTVSCSVHLARDRNQFLKEMYLPD